MENTEKNSKNTNIKKKSGTRTLLLVFYDFVVFVVVGVLFYFLGNSRDLVSLYHYLIAGTLISGSRLLLSVYSQVWRYEGMSGYIRLILADALAFIVFFVIVRLVPFDRVPFIRLFAFFCINLLAVTSMRIAYRYAWKCASFNTKRGEFMRWILRVIANTKFEAELDDKPVQTKIAIVGAGQTGVALSHELVNNTKSSYIPCCFIDINPVITGRYINGIPVLSEYDITEEKLKGLGIKEVVFALPSMDGETRKKLYEKYSRFDCKLKTYDFPTMYSDSSGKRHIREMEIDELLFRDPISVLDDSVTEYYKGKVVLITGGGGSIGSELCRQIARISPKRLVILDIYENGAYDIQQELKMAYGNAIDCRIEIVSVVNRPALERVFAEHRPEIVLHAAAHKHVPLMEHNCIEAVENNVFGTLNTVELSEAYGVEHFIMISTDKAVNPTNVMGATKRMCELIVLSHSIGSKTVFTATRFGNVLGSAGSVIPLFKKQIMNGGPVTITDKRIIRYFMTIPEASQLVLSSGAMAKNGELFVLDMGKPVKILDLAENMIRLAGMVPDKDIEIVETGLRPGEKLYEELLIKPEKLTKTDNSLIFIEKDEPLAASRIDEMLNMLRAAVEAGSDEGVVKALHEAVFTYKTPDEINKHVA